MVVMEEREVALVLLQTYSAVLTGHIQEVKEEGLLYLM
jgi:hypothetical protein